MENPISLADIKKEFEIIKSCQASEEYSDGYNANSYPFRGLVNKTLTFSVLKRNDNPLLTDIIELGYIAVKLGLKSCWLNPAIGFFIKGEGEKVQTLNKSWIAKLLKHFSKWNFQEIKEELMSKKRDNKIFYQDRIEWQKKEYGKRFFYRKRLAIRIATKFVYRIEPKTDSEKANKRYKQLMEVS